jgi:ABC-2 type transport system permease protein
MNWAMVGRLIWKDWYLSRVTILLALVGGMASLAMVAATHGSLIPMILGIIVVVGILIGVGQVVMMSTVTERKQQTLPFVMSLAISYREYTAAKIAGSLLMYLVLWTALVAGVVATILLAPGYPHGLVPFALIMSVEILMSTCLVMAISISTESHGWTVAATQLGVLGVNGIGWWIVRFPDIGGAMRNPTMRWSSTATALLTAEFAAIALMLAITFFVQARKKDFV